MKNLTIALAALMLFAYSLKATAQEFDTEKVKSEIAAAVAAEQAAFESGDCDTVLDHMDDQITFLANGRRAPSKAVVGKFCASIPRPFQEATINKQEIFPISSTVGYVIRNLEYSKDDNTKVSEYVTKIWKKSEGKWRITHLHSTIK